LHGPHHSAQKSTSTGAPDFKNKYAVYRLGKGKGFRVVGERL
jgi:hypothetical protein